MSQMKRHWEKMNEQDEERRYKRQDYYPHPSKPPLFRIPDVETEEEFKIRRDWSVKHKFNQTTVPKAITSPSPPGFKQYTVMLVVGGHNFECLITVDANTSEGEATTLADQKYRADIQRWLFSIPGATSLPPAVKHIGTNSSTGPAAILPDSITDVVEANLKGVRDALRENMVSRIRDEYRQTNSGGPQIEIPPQEYACEADKPEGTRDVDQFLREQQNKLWGIE